jgi:hypothetical protein
MKATEELQSLSQNGFKECSPHFQSRRQKFIVDQGDYPERNKAEMILLFCICNKWFREYFEATTYMFINILPVHFTYV